MAREEGPWTNARKGERRSKVLPTLPTSLHVCRCVTTGLRDGCGLMPGHDVARHVASVGRGLPSVAGDRRRDGLAVMSLDWLRAGGNWEASERKEGRKEGDGKRSALAGGGWLPWMSVVARPV